MKGPATPKPDSGFVDVHMNITISAGGRTLYWAEDTKHPPALAKPIQEQALRLILAALDKGEFTITQAGNIEAEVQL